jgi:hypothetical protein
MALFSERYGYMKPSQVIIRGGITEEIENAVCSAFDYLKEWMNDIDSHMEYDHSYNEMGVFLWTQFLNKRKEEYWYRNRNIPVEVIKDRDMPWYRKLDIIELSFKWLLTSNDRGARTITERFAKYLNHEFDRLNYAYRIVDKEIVEISSDQEIAAIETAIDNSEDNVRLHLKSALGLLAEKPVGDYRNSIKESVSAVEAVCREMTGKNSLGDALNELANTGVEIPRILKLGFDKLYGYTCNPETGIRHALMVDDETYVPSSAEAIFMMVSCSAFINYLNAKRAR